MMRPVLATLGALSLLLGWLVVVAVQANGDSAAMALSLGDSAHRTHLPGLAARAYLLSAELERRRLYSLGVDRASAAGQTLIRHIIATRMAAARLLLQSGYVDAAERIALEGARADYDDVQARALLLEVRLRGDDSAAARRELMLMLVKQEQPQLLCLLGASFAHEGALDDAAACFQRALQADAKHVPSLVALANLRARQQQPQVAAQLLQQAASAAQTADERDLVAAATRPSYSAVPPALGALSAWWSTHCVTFLVALAYLVFLVSPTIISTLRRPS